MDLGQVLLTVLSFLLLTPHTNAILNWLLRSDNTVGGTDFAASSPSPVEIAKQYGYETETHAVKTPDGYILSLHRIQNGSIRSAKEPFILQHGLSLNSGQWLVLEPSQNLALMLADNGYDVWLTNIRGNMFSRKHEKLSPESGEFWKYGWHEHGTIDVPAMIDYILAQTRQKQLFYAGHSMGTTMFFVMTSMRPEYNAKIKHMFALAPVAFCGKMQSPITKLAPAIRSYQNLLKATNNHIPSEILAFQLGKMGMCTVTKIACGGVLDTIGGVNPKNYLILSNTSTPPKQYYLPFQQAWKLSSLVGSLETKLKQERLYPNERIVSKLVGRKDSIVWRCRDCGFMNFLQTIQEALWRYFPDVISVNQAVHYAQLINNPYSFRLFDYYEENLIKYAYIIPPEYPVKNISAPMTFFYSNNDYLSAADDVEQFSKNLQNVDLFLVGDPKFSHFDYIIAMDAKELVYTPLLKIANSYHRIN